MAKHLAKKYSWFLAIFLGLYWIPFYLTAPIWHLSENVALFIDSLSHFRMYILVFFFLLFFVCLAYKQWLWATSALLGCVAEFIFFIPYLLVPPNAPADESHIANKIKVYQHNIRYDNKNLTELIDYIRAERPDVLLLQEFSTSNEKQIQVLKEIYSTFETCIFMPIIGKVAVISQFSMVEGSKTCEHGHINIQVRAFDNQIINLSSMHLHWPFPFSQMEQVAALVSKIPQDNLILGGDFNSVPWGMVLGKIREHTGAIPMQGLRITLRKDFSNSLGLLYLPVDHVLSTPQFIPISVELGPRHGSDHVSTLVEYAYSRPLK